MSTVSTRTDRDHSPATSSSFTFPFHRHYDRAEAALNLTRAPNAHNLWPPPRLRRPEPHCFCTGDPHLAYRPAALGDTCQRIQGGAQLTSSADHESPTFRVQDLNSAPPPSSRPPRTRIAASEPRLCSLQCRVSPSADERPPVSNASQRSQARTTPPRASVVSKLSSKPEPHKTPHKIKSQRARKIEWHQNTQARRTCTGALRDSELGDKEEAGSAVFCLLYKRASSQACNPHSPNGHPDHLESSTCIPSFTNRSSLIVMLHSL